jgi:hypothetical protein
MSFGQARTQGFNNVPLARLLVANSIINSKGMFFYSGTPTLGNLIESVGVAVAGTDPFGNAYQAGDTVYDNVFGGVGQLSGGQLTLFSGATKEVSLSPAGMSVFNSHGALIYNIDVSRDATFLYADTGTAAQGALIASQANAAGTDQFGNAYLKGFTTYANDGFGTFIQHIAGILIFGNTTYPTEIAGAGAINLQTTGTLLIEAGTSGANFQLNQDTSTLLGRGILDLTGIATPANPAAGNARYFADTRQIARNVHANGDVWCLERQSKHVASDIPIVSTTPATIFTFNAGVGVYRIHGVLTCVNGGSGTLQPQTMRIAGTASPGNTRVAVRSAQMGSTTSTAAFDQITAFNADPGVIRTPALSEIFSIEFDGVVNINVAGTVTVEAREVTSAADVGFTVKAFSFCDFWPE